MLWKLAYSLLYVHMTNIILDAESWFGIRNSLCADCVLWSVRVSVVAPPHPHSTVNA